MWVSSSCCWVSPFSLILSFSFMDYMFCSAVFEAH
jgi:hypothetical protein